MNRISDVIDVGIKGVPGSDTTNFTIKTTNPEGVVKDIARLARDNGWDVLQLFKEQRSLEEIFHEIVTKEK